MQTNKIHISESFGGRLDPLQFHYERMDMIHNIISTKQWCKLKDVVKNVKVITKDLSPSDVYIGLENIASNTGEYCPTSEKDSISSAAIFAKGDILFPKLRPYLNKVYRADFGGKCSTEFHVFQAKKIDADFLAIVLRSNLIVAQTKHLMTGNTLPRLQTGDIENLIIPLPPMEVQQEIVAIYTKAQEEKQTKEQEAKELLGSIDSYLLDQLGINLPKKQDNQSERFYLGNVSSLLGKRYDPYYHKPYFEKAFDALRESKYKLHSLREISSVITSGITPLSGGDAYTNSEEGVAFIRSGDIDIDGDILFDDLLYIKPEIHNKKMKSSKVYDNDIMIAIVGATIGQVGIYHSDKEANINQAIALVRLEGAINHEYIKEVIKSAIGQLNLDRLKRPVARANINLEEIASIVIPIPPIEQQNELADKIKDIRIKAKHLQQDGATLLATAKVKIEKIILG